MKRHLKLKRMTRKKRTRCFLIPRSLIFKIWSPCPLRFDLDFLYFESHSNSNLNLSPLRFELERANSMLIVILFLYYSFHNCSQSSQLILKNLILKFPEMYLASEANFWIKLRLMKANSCMPLLNILHKYL